MIVCYKIGYGLGHPSGHSATASRGTAGNGKGNLHRRLGAALGWKDISATHVAPILVAQIGLHARSTRSHCEVLLADRCASLHHAAEQRGRRCQEFRVYPLGFASEGSAAGLRCRADRHPQSFAYRRHGQEHAACHHQLRSARSAGHHSDTSYSLADRRGAVGRDSQRFAALPPHRPLATARGAGWIRESNEPLVTCKVGAQP